MSLDLASLRQEYTKASLDLDSVCASPFDQFQQWFDEAQKSKVTEPNAMVLSTSDLSGHITQRTVLLKAIDPNGFVFYTNYKSRKARQIEENPQVCILFPWYQLERQVIITGRAEKVSTAQSMKYFLSRPLGSQLGAWVSHQSEVITSRSILEMKLQEMKAKFKDGKIPFQISGVVTRSYLTPSSFGREEPAAFTTVFFTPDQTQIGPHSDWPLEGREHLSEKIRLASHRPCRQSQRKPSDDRCDPGFL